jgi:hypothetical protein
MATAPRVMIRLAGACILGSMVGGCGGGAKPAADSAAPKADSVTAATIAASPVPAGTSVSAPAPDTKSAPSSPVTSARPASATRPDLKSLTPSSGSNAGGNIIQILINGERFTPTGNTVYFDTIKLDGLVASADGRSIRVNVPGSYPARGEAAPAAVQNGTYRVYVVNANGTSDTLTFTIRD